MRRTVIVGLAIVAGLTVVLEAQYGFWTSQNGAQTLRVNTTTPRAGVSIRQDGTGPILELYDGATRVWAVNDGGNVVWASGSCGGWSDALLCRDAANIIAQRNGTSTQTLRVYRTYTDASNYERVNIGDSTTIFGVSSSPFIAMRHAGTGTARPLGFGTSNAVLWGLATTGQLAPAVTNAYDLGTPSYMPRSSYAGTSFILGTNAALRAGAPTVGNVGANSCGTSTATIAGINSAGKVTVGATAGTACRITFSSAWTNAPSCVVTNETTANLARATSTTTTADLAGTFVAGDVLAYSCVGY